MSEKVLLEGMQQLQSSVDELKFQQIGLAKTEVTNQLQTECRLDKVEYRQSILEKKVDANHLETGGRLDKLEVGLSSLKDDVSVIKDDMTVLKDTVMVLDKRTHKMGIQFEEYGHKLDLTLEVVMSNQAKILSLDSIRDQVSEHEHRISAVEHFVRKHPN